jgi:hypothetical protein
VLRKIEILEDYLLLCKKLIHLQKKSSMRLKDKIYIFVTIGLFAISCAPNHIVHKSYKRSLIDTVYHFPSLSYISVIEKGNTGIQNDSLSLVSKAILDSLVLNNSAFKAIRLEIDNSVLLNNTKSEILGIFNAILTSNSITKIDMPPNIKQIIEQNNQRFYMATLIEGFGRKSGNYGKQVAKGIGVGILTLGLYAPVPIKNRIRLMNFIIDKETMKIVYFSSTLPIEKSPTEIKIIDKQYQKIIPPWPSMNRQ